MSEKKIVVPDGMIAAVQESVEIGCSNYRRILTAALLWLSENPIVPTQEQAKDIIVDLNNSGYCIADATGNAKSIAGSQMCDAGRIVAESWQRRMFAPEPVVPYELKDLLSPYRPDGDAFNAIQEAYRLGVEAGRK